MRDQLINYVDLLFAGAPNAGEIKQEILQNTLDKYDDLIAQGKSPQAAYSLAISGIGDINEILGADLTGENSAPAAAVNTASTVQKEARHTPAWKKAVRAVAVFLYIISVIPLFVLSTMGMEVIGLCGTVSIVAVATAMMIIAAGSKQHDHSGDSVPLSPRQEVRKAVKTTITAVCVAVYLIVNFLTQAWYITWLIFPISAAVQGLITACMDLKEASES